MAGATQLEPPIVEDLEPPSAALLALEGRAALELAALVPAWPFLRRLAPPGDGHGVLVLPGFLASDTSTLPLRWVLRQLGYRVHGWRLGRNLGPEERVVTGLRDRLHALCEANRGPLSLVGWSLGGIYARELARRFPGDVRQVITLASPFRNVDASNVRRLRAITRPSERIGQGSEIDARLREPIPVPTTAVWSRTDGIVAGRSCIEAAGPRSESVEVETSHCGMGFHPAPLLVVADRLGQPAGAWQPFDCAKLDRWPFRGWPRRPARPEDERA